MLLGILLLVLQSHSWYWNTKNSMKPRSLLHGGIGDQDRQMVHDHQAGDDHNNDKDEESPNGADSWQEGEMKYKVSGMVVVGLLTNLHLQMSKN